MDFYDYTKNRLDFEAVAKNYEESLIYARYFIAQLLNRCGRQESSEFKSFLETTLNDTLVVIYRPEFPSAIKLLLQVIYHLFFLLDEGEVLRFYVLDKLG